MSEDELFQQEEIKVKAPVSWVTRNIGIDVDSLERLDSYASKINLLGLEERRIIMTITGPREPLPYPTRTVRNIHGAPVDIYVIPEDKRQQVLDELYFLTNTPSMDEKMWDIHEEKIFNVRDFMVTREGFGNFLVCPAYLHSGGTLLDWMDPDHIPGVITAVEQIKPEFMRPAGDGASSTTSPLPQSSEKQTNAKPQNNKHLE